MKNFKTLAVVNQNPVDTLRELINAEQIPAE